jgi:hypothetical protein
MTILWTAFGGVIAYWKFSIADFGEMETTRIAA